MLPANLLPHLLALMQAYWLLLLGGWLGRAVGRPYRWPRALRCHGQPAPATVVDVVAGPAEGDRLPLRFPTLTGVVWDWPNATCVLPSQHFVGDTLPVHYLPRPPRRCRLRADGYTTYPARNPVALVGIRAPVLPFPARRMSGFSRPYPWSSNE